MPRPSRDPRRCDPETQSPLPTHPSRDIRLAQINRIGEKAWCCRSGYGHRSLSEAGFSGFKAILGEQLRARSGEGLVAEASSRVWAYNLWRTPTDLTAATPTS